VSPKAGPEDKCSVCKSTVGVCHFAITVDGHELRLQVFLCQEHGDRFIFRVGQALVGLFRDAPESVT
jgi:hypothetical protein